MPIRFIAWNQSEKIIKEGNNWDSVLLLLSQDNLHIWLDVQNQVKEEVEWLGKVFNFHPLALEDCINLNQRSKLEEYDGYIFFVLHLCRLENDQRIETDELHIFLGPRFIVSVHDKPMEIVDNCFKRCKDDPQTLDKGCDFIFYMLSDSLVERYFPLLDKIEDDIDELEDRMVSSPNPESLKKLFLFKQNLVRLRKIIAPLREVFGLIHRHESGLIKEKNYLYIRDVHDHLIRIHDMIDTYRDMAGNMLDVYLSTVSNRLNEVMKRLTIIATIFLPLGFVTGFFGMNFQHMPFSNNLIFAIALVLCILIPIGMLYWFYKQGWF
ncbi:MAG: magnesium and cobalt transport protein CorA [Candidatus Dadabacteria bacterium]